MGERDPVCLIPVDLLKSRVKIIPPIPHTVSMEMPLVVIFYRNLWLRHPHRLLRLPRMKPFPKVFKNLKFLENQETDGNQSRTCEKFETKTANAGVRLSYQMLASLSRRDSWKICAKFPAKRQKTVEISLCTTKKQNS